MENSFSIRLATEADLPEIREIYNYYVEISTCTYQIEPDTEAERQIWFEDHTEQFPVLVAVEKSKNSNKENIIEEIVGWGSLSSHRSRCGYSKTVENSIYVRQDKHRRGIGRALTIDLIQRAKDLGYHTILAGISADQTASIKLHESLGFAKVAHYCEVGFKFDQWLDVVYLQIML